MSVDDWDSAVGSLRAVTIEAETMLTADDVANVWSLIDAGEPGVAFEVLCTQLYEYDAEVSEGQQHRLAQIGTFLGVQDTGLWEDLRS